MQAAIEAARERGFREAILWMLEENRRAAAFYERRGWTRDGAGGRPTTRAWSPPPTPSALPRSGCGSAL